MTRSNGRAFNEWLRAQLKAKKMSQRQLAQQSGVDHSTISRLVRGDRMPSLGTATKLARGLRELGENDEGPQYLGLMGGGIQNPTARIEYALRADEALSESQVRQVMEYYLAVRMRRMGAAFNHDTSSYGRGDNGRPNGPHLPPTVGSNGVGGPIVPRPSLVAGGGRVVTETRPTSPARLRPVRSQEGY
jgi:transcriptional regulator with XRE-family HTH domain